MLKLRTRQSRPLHLCAKLPTHRRQFQPARGQTQASSVPPGPTRLTADQLLSFERKGHIQLRDLLPAEVVQQLAHTLQAVIEQRQPEALLHRVRVLCGHREAQACHSTEDAKAALRRARAEVGFLQFFNLWRQGASSCCTCTNSLLPNHLQAIKVSVSAEQPVAGACMLTRPSHYSVAWLPVQAQQQRP